VSGENKQTVLILCNNDGGLYKFRRELVLALAKRYRVAIACPPGDYKRDITALGAEVIDTRMERRGKNPLHDLALMRGYIRLIKQQKPLCVLTYTVKPNIYGGLAARFRHAPFIANITGLGTAVENGGVMQKLLLAMYRPALKRAHCVCFQNEENMRFFTSRMSIPRCRLICGSGVNLKDFTPAPYPSDENGLKLLFIGRAMEAKGVNELLAAAERLHAEGDGIAFTFVGGCDEQQYKDRLERLTEKGVINWVGEQRSVKEFIADSHAVVNPSHHEGMSNVLLEASAMARPVIASDIPGCRETFVNGESGIAFEAGNADALVGAIRRFAALANDERERMGRAARAHVERYFNRDEVIKTYLDLIEELK